MRDSYFEYPDWSITHCLGLSRVSVVGHWYTQSYLLEPHLRFYVSLSILSPDWLFLLLWQSTTHSRTRVAEECWVSKLPGFFFLFCFENCSNSKTKSVIYGVSHKCDWTGHCRRLAKTEEARRTRKRLKRDLFVGEGRTSGEVLVRLVLSDAVAKASESHS